MQAWARRGGRPEHSDLYEPRRQPALLHARLWSQADPASDFRVRPNPAQDAWPNTTFRLRPDPPLKILCSLMSPERTPTPFVLDPLGDARRTLNRCSRGAQRASRTTARSPPDAGRPELGQSWPNVDQLRSNLAAGACRCSQGKGSSILFCKSPVSARPPILQKSIWRASLEYLFAWPAARCGSFCLALSAHLPVGQGRSGLV